MFVSGRSGWLVVAGVYTLGSLLFLWPMPAQMGSHIWGDRFDAWTTLWLMDHLHRHLSDGTLHAVTDDILFPIGYNLWSFGHTALQLLGVALMFCGIPLVPAYNLLLIGGFATSALAAHLLGRELSQDHRGGFVAGITFASSPYLYGEGAAGCIELVAAGLIPLFAWSLLRLLREPGWRRALPAAGILALVGPFNWYYTLFAGMLGLGLCVWQLLEGRGRAVAWMLGAMLTAAAVDAPLIPLVQRETPTRPPISGALFESTEAWERATAIADGSVPLQALSVAMLEEHDAMQVMENSTTLQALALARFTVNPLESTPGMLAFVVGIVGAAAAGRRGWGWAAIALGATLLTLGPFLRLDSSPQLSELSASYPLPYYYFYHYLPFFSKAYRPYRIGVITLCACAALGAAGMAVLSRHLPRSLSHILVFFLGIVAVSQPFWAGDRPAWRPLADATIPPIYQKLAELPRGGVIELPLHYQPLTLPNARFQYNQVLHHQPLLNCNQLIRRTDLLAFRDYVSANPFLAALVDLGRRSSPIQFSSTDLKKAYDDGFRYVVLHTAAASDAVRLAGNEIRADLLGQPAVEMLEQTLGSPLLSDPNTRIYGLPTPTTEVLYTWDGQDVQTLDLLVDTRKLGLSLPLEAGTSLPLYQGFVREFSLWARPESGEGLRLRLEGATVQEVPLRLVAGQWSWQQIFVGETVQISLVAPQKASVRLTRLQVLQ